jgi:hypothetical protein
MSGALLSKAETVVDVVCLIIERACIPWEKRRRLNLKLWSVGVGRDPRLLAGADCRCESIAGMCPAVTLGGQLENMTVQREKGSR